MQFISSDFFFETLNDLRIYFTFDFIHFRQCFIIDNLSNSAASHQQTLADAIQHVAHLKR